MQLLWGSYLFDPNATKIASHNSIIWNEGEQPLAFKAALHVEGYLSPQPASQSALAIAESALRTALARQYQDLVFLQDDGTITPLALKNAGSITGVRIVDGPNFQTTEGPEYAQIRSFDFMAEAEYPLPGSALLLVSFTEELTFSGGGPIYKFRRAKNTIAQKQLVWPFDTFRVIQQGQAVGYRFRPNPAPMLFPGALMESPDIRAITPKRRGKGYSNYGIAWTYRFEDTAPLVGVPNLWL